VPPPSDVEAVVVSGGESRMITVMIPENVREIINIIKSCQVPAFLDVVEPLWTPTVKLSKKVMSKILLDKMFHDAYASFSAEQLSPLIEKITVQLDCLQPFKQPWDRLLETLQYKDNRRNFYASRVQSQIILSE
jgi:hypothetical protein